MQMVININENVVTRLFNNNPEDYGIVIVNGELKEFSLEKIHEYKNHAIHY